MPFYRCFVSGWFRYVGPKHCLQSTNLHFGWQELKRLVISSMVAPLSATTHHINDLSPLSNVLETEWKSAALPLQNCLRTKALPCNIIQNACMNDLVPQLFRCLCHICDDLKHLKQATQSGLHRGHTAISGFGLAHFHMSVWTDPSSAPAAASAEQADGPAWVIMYNRPLAGWNHQNFAHSQILNISLSWNSNSDRDCNDSNRNSKSNGKWLIIS